MKREDLITYKMMQRLSETPGGLMTADFSPITSGRVNNYFKSLIKRGLITLEKVGLNNRYHVSAEQWARLILPRPINMCLKCKATPGDGSVYGEFLEMASHPDGVNNLYRIRQLSSNDVSLRLSKLAIKGRLIAVRLPKATRTQYFLHKADADKYRATYVVPAPKPPKPRAPRPYKPKVQSGGAFPATVKFKTEKLPRHEQTKQLAREKWNATPPHFPKDAAGNPLWTFTVCPGFTSDPIRTNTYFQAG